MQHKSSERLKRPVQETFNLNLAQVSSHVQSINTGTVISSTNSIQRQSEMVTRNNSKSKLEPFKKKVSARGLISKETFKALKDPKDKKSGAKVPSSGKSRTNVLRSPQPIEYESAKDIGKDQIERKMWDDFAKIFGEEIDAQRSLGVKDAEQIIEAVLEKQREKRRKETEFKEVPKPKKGEFTSYLQDKASSVESPSLSPSRRQLGVKRDPSQQSLLGSQRAES